MGQVVGVGRSAETLRTAVELGVIDSHTSDWKEALEGADLVLLATPVGQMEAVLSAILPHLEAGCLTPCGCSVHLEEIAVVVDHPGDRFLVDRHRERTRIERGWTVEHSNIGKGQRHWIETRKHTTRPIDSVDPLAGLPAGGADGSREGDRRFRCARVAGEQEQRPGPKVRRSAVERAETDGDGPT